MTLKEIEIYIPEHKGNWASIAYYSLSRLSNGADFNNDLTIFRSSLIASVAGKGSEASS